jgi:hypothetical protein
MLTTAPSPIHAQAAMTMLRIACGAQPRVLLDRLNNEQQRTNAVLSPACLGGSARPLSLRDYRRLDRGEAKSGFGEPRSDSLCAIALAAREV